MQISGIDMKALELLAEEDPELAAKLALDYRKAMTVLARSDPSWFCQYVLRHEDTGAMIYQTPMHHEIHKTILASPRTLVWTYPGMGKALDVATPIPTPRGWRTMGELCVGEEVFSSSGQTCRITAKTPVLENREVFELVFDGGATIRADGDHLWLAVSRRDRQRHNAPHPVTTREMFSSVRADDDRANWRIHCNGPAQYPEQELPIHPYVLGAWLGDGTSGDRVLTFHKDDQEIFNRCRALEGGEPPFPIPGREHLQRGRIGPLAFKKKLKSLGVFGRKGSKFIPEVYLRGSEQQRRELLAGLLDTDGTVSSAGLVEFCSMQKCLAEGVVELAASLGFKPSLRPGNALLKGKVVGTRYRVTFTPHYPVFCLARKQKAHADALASLTKLGTSSLRYVVDVRRVETTPVVCISVDSPDHTFLCGREYIVTHNCEASGSPVLLADGSWKPVEELREWTKLLTWDGHSPELKEVTGRSTPNGKRRCHRIELSNGALLYLTEHHPLLREDFQWTQARFLRAGDKIYGIGRLSLSGSGDFSAEEAEILGYLLGGRVLGKDVILRKINRNKKWSARREDLLRRAGWQIREHGRLSLRVSNESADISPSEFLIAWAKVKRGWPVDLRSEVWSLPEDRIQRLLCGFMSMCFLFEDWHKPFGGTKGLGSDRAPSSLLHPCRATLDVLRRLFYRVSVVAELLEWEDAHRIWDSGGIWIDTKKRRRPIYQLRVDSQEVWRFWPTKETGNPDRPVYELLTIRKVTELPHLLDTWALEVQEAEHSYIEGGVLSHNTNQVAIGHALWRLGKDPNTTIGILCNSREMSAKIVSSMKKYIASSQELKDVFPHLMPGDTWGEFRFSVDRESFRKDPSVQALSLGGEFLGASLNGLILDDVDNYDTVLTQAARDATEQRVKSKALTRLRNPSDWAVAIGNVWHENDLMHRFAKSGMWKVLRYPILDPVTKESSDPLRFPVEWVENIRDTQGPLLFDRLYLLKARIDGEQRFRREWLDVALAKGRQECLFSEGLQKVPSGCRTITGVDIGVKKKATSDPTAITTILEIPGKDNASYQLLNLRKGRWDAKEIIDQITEEQRLFGSLVFVESNGAQDLLIQLMNMRGAGFQAQALDTGRNKHDPMFGVESLAGEMASGFWTIPSWDGTLEGAEPLVVEICEEMLAYLPQNHTGDMLMSLWIAREGARKSRNIGTKKIEFGRIRLRR